MLALHTDNLRLELQWQKGFNIFTGPSDGFPQRIDTGLMAGGPASGSFIEVTTPVTTNLGDIQWLGGVVSGKLNKLGPGDLNLFLSAAMSRTNPNTNLFSMPFALMDTDDIPGPSKDDMVVNAGFGLLYDEGNKKSRSGSAIYNWRKI